MPHPRRLPLFLLALGLAGCSGAPPAQLPGGAAAGSPGPRRVILISLDGAGADTLQDLHRRGLLGQGGFERFFRDGQVADALIPVDPTLTSTSHISLATGYPPSATGIVGNQFHPGGTPFQEKVNGFEAPIGTETLWEAVHRQGRRAAVLAWPGMDGNGPRRTADLGMAYPNSPEVGPLIITLARSDWQPAPAETSREVASRSPVMTTHVVLGPEGKTPPPPAFDLLAIDSTDDGQADYDGFVVVEPSGGVSRPLRTGQWHHMAWPRPDGRAFSWLKPMKLAPDLSDAVLSLDGIYPTRAYPQDFAAALEKADLHWSGGPNNGGLGETWAGRPGIDLETWSQEAERLTRFLGAALRTAAARPDWDLLMAYFPAIDSAGHRLLLLDPRQPGYSEARKEELDRARLEVWRSVDRELAKLLAATDLRRTTVVLVSDHGMTPVHTSIDPNALLSEMGLLAKGKGAAGSAAAPVAYAAADGGAAHIYLDAGGDAQAAERALADLAARYAGWQVKGEPVIEKVYTRREAAAIGLDSPNSGDLIAFAREGYVFRPLPGGKVSAPPPVHGAHGYLNTHPDMRAIYLALGAGVKPGPGGTVQGTEVAPRVAAWLGIEPPRRAFPKQP